MPARRTHRRAAHAAALAATMLLVACARATSAPTSTADDVRPPIPIAPTAAPLQDPAVPRSTRAPLPVRGDGYGVPQPTPPELTDRRSPTRDLLPPPADGRFASTIAPVPDAALARSTWSPECPVARADLRYVTVVFRGFDGAAHTGELLVAARVAEDVVSVFAALFAADFPIEAMRIVEPAELTVPPTGDDNTTTAFVCRPIVGGAGWSAHASGLAIDVNPFQNPYRRGDLVLPELASSYLDRATVRPGMILGDGPVVAAFDRIGWTWGGRWRSLLDLQHFSQTST